MRTSARVSWKYESPVAAAAAASSDGETESPYMIGQASSMGSTSSEQHIAARLSEGQRALRSIRCRVSGSMIVLGICCSCVTPINLLNSGFPYWFWSLSWAVQGAGIVILNLAPLPDDPALTKVVLVLIALIYAGLIVIDHTRRRESTVVEWYCQPGEESCDVSQLYFTTAHAFNIYVIVVVVVAVAFCTLRQLQKLSWVILSSIFGFNILWEVWRLDELLNAATDLVWFIICAFPGLHLRVQSWMRNLFAWRMRKAAAAGIASLVGNCDVKDILAQARTRFRSISLENIREEQLADNLPNPQLAAVSIPAKLGRCDAFISHSWHDDAGVKWRRLQEWRRDFRKDKIREPIVWFDKCCIDQTDIELDLRCLPIFMAGCNKLVIFCGPTYFERLWCIMEIFTFVHMGGRLDGIVLVPVLRPGQEAEDHDAIKQGLDNFDAAQCKCFNPDEKDQMLTIIRTAFGSTASFNSAVVKIIRKVWSRDFEDDGAGMNSSDSEASHASALSFSSSGS